MTRPALYTISAVLALGLLCLAPCGLTADEPFTTLTRDVVSTTTTVAASGSTNATIQIGKSTIQGADWNMLTDGTINVTVEFEHSNASGGPFRVWTSVPSTASTTSFTITSGVNGTDLRLFPSYYVKVTITNDDSSDLTITRFSLFTQ